MPKRKSLVKKKKKNNLLNTSKKTTFLTPEWLKLWIKKQFNIEEWFDSAPKHGIIDGKKIDCLEEDFQWGKINYCNPPYKSEKGKKNGIEGFIRKALSEYEKSKREKETIFLVPFRITKYFQNLVMPNLKTMILLPLNSIAFLDENGQRMKNYMPLQLALYFIGTRTESEGSVKTVSIENDEQKSNIAIVIEYPK